MAKSWRDAKECAVRDNLPQVFHDCDDDTYGACRKGDTQGSFKKGIFIEHRCICMPASMNPEEMQEKEQKFRRENPDW